MAETTGTSTPKARGKTGKPAPRKASTAKKAIAAATAAPKPTVRKTQEKKTAAAPAKTTIRKRVTKVTISDEDRRSMIAEAAYLRAERRNFVGGDPEQDWLEAEADVNASLKGPTH